MKDNKLEKRMYFLVPYNISPIQQAIQAGHAALEYAHVYGQNEDYIDFIENWKTWIILNGGTTNSTRNLDADSIGTLNQSLDSIYEFNKENPDSKIDVSYFHEPDLNDALTAICLVVDERVFNRKDYPDFIDWFVTKQDAVNELTEGEKIKEFRILDKETYYELYKLEFGKDITFLKELLNTKKLA